MAEKHYCECLDKNCKEEIEILSPMGSDLWRTYKNRFPDCLVISRKKHDNIPEGYNLHHKCPTTIMIKKEE